MKRLLILITFCSLICRAETDAEIRAKLEKPITFRVREVAVPRAVEALAKQAGVTCDWIDWRGESKETISLELKAVRPIDILEALRHTQNFDFFINSGTLKAGIFKPVVKFYDVSDLTISPIDDGCMFVGLEAPTPLVGGGAVNGFQPAAEVEPTLTVIADIIRNRVRPEKWDPALGTSIEERGGFLVITATELMHKDIEALLNLFREQKRQASVDVRSMTIKSADFEKIIAESNARGTRFPKLDDKAIESLGELIREQTAHQYFAGSNVVLDSQACQLGEWATRKYIGDFEYGAEYQPVTREFHAGSYFRVKPILSFDQKVVRVEMIAAFADALKLDDAIIQHGGSMNVTETIEERPRPGEKENPVKKDVKIYTVTVPGGLTVQLPTLAVSKVFIEVVATAGTWMAASAPLFAKDGVVNGHEFVALVRVSPNQKIPVHSQPIPLPELRPELKQQLEKNIHLPEEANVLESLELIAQEAGIPLIVDRSSISGKLDSAITFSAKVLTAKNALAEVCASAGIQMLPLNSLLIATSSPRPSGGMVTQIFSVKELCSPIYERFDGLLDSQPYAANNPFAANRSVAMAAADIAVMIKEKYFPEDFAAAETSIEESNDKLIVVNTPEVMAKIERKLVELRADLAKQFQCTARWVVVDKAKLITEFGKSIPSVMSADQTQKVLRLCAAPDSQVISTSRLTGFNHQMVFGQSGIVRNLITGYSTAQLGKPEIQTCGEGVKFGVRVDASGSTRVRIDARMHKLTALTAKDMVAENGPRPANPPPAVGIVHSPAVATADKNTEAVIEDGGAAVFQMPVPAWIEGENPEAVRKGERIMLLVVEVAEIKQ